MVEPRYNKAPRDWEYVHHNRDLLYLPGINETQCSDNNREYSNNVLFNKTACRPKKEENNF